MKKYLDINALRQSGRTPKWFGLGFIQLKLSETHRMHFWHPDLKPYDDNFENEFHDHRYPFESNVLVGEITNEIATAAHSMIATDTVMKQVCCSGGGSEFISHIHIQQLCRFATSAGHSYSVHENTFHRTFAERCVTLQIRGDTVKDKARVLSSKQSLNPFDDTMDENILWECIADLLPTIQNPGYHINRIEKGVLGEASKIKEEMDEFLDSIDQDARIMQLVELSDMVGAITAYLEKYFPGMALPDLVTMDRITHRAFVNRHRK